MVLSLKTEHFAWPFKHEVAVTNQFLEYQGGVNKENTKPPVQMVFS
jgi:hypothetical protein